MSPEPSPESRKPCAWCCGDSMLNIGPGKFRDFDSDYGYGIPVCGGCGGLGFEIDSPDFKARTVEIMRLRFEYCPVRDPGPMPVMALRALESLVREIKEHYRLYGGGEKECFAAEIVAGSEDATLATGRELVARQLQLARTSPMDDDPGGAAGRPAIIAAFEGKLDDAEKLFQEAIARHPGSSVIAHDYAVFLVNFRCDYGRALPWFEKSTALEPRRATHYFQTASCLHAMKRSDEAKKYVRACRTCPDYEKLPADIRGAIATLPDEGSAAAPD